jgi:hypothetical protein
MRIWLPGLLVTAGLGIAASPAQAAMAYTGEAASGETSATAYGYVNPQGEKTVWSFAYGPTTKYGSYTALGSVPAGSDSVLVAAPMRSLKAGVTYHYLLLAIPYDSSGNPDWAHASYGADHTFITTKGTLVLSSTRLSVRRGAVSIPLQCASTLNCSGGLNLDTRARVGTRLQTVHCASQRFSLTASARSTFTPKLTSSCARLLRSARGHRLNGTTNASVSTGQAFSNPSVTLSG